MTIANELVKAVISAQSAGKRDKQKEVGPSEVGGCARALWSRLNGVEATNQNTIRFPAVFGTAIHSYFQEAFKRQDPFEERYILESEWKSEAYNLMGHIDLYDRQTGEVVDWKSSTKKSLNGGYFPSKQQRWQVQLYGFLLEENDQLVKNVTLVGIPRDGNERDIVVHSEPYDRNIAMQAIEWLQTVRGLGSAPAPERDVSFCQHYCAFYDSTGTKGCVGRPKEQAEGVVIDDPNYISMANDYLRLSKQIKELDDLKESIKAQLEGVNGITSNGIKILWSKMAGRKTLDTGYVEQFFERHSEPIPYKQSSDSYRLVVKNVGDD